MKLDIQNIGIADLIALIVVCAGLYLTSKGINGNVAMVLILVVSFYFGNKFTR